jgi:RimJ/RimL family protein N-acetyltransferase
VRLELLIGVENEASKRVAAACGYEREGVLRSSPCAVRSPSARTRAHERADVDRRWRLTALP